MQLPNSLVKDFAKITNDTKDKNTDTFVYGTARNVNGQVYVMFDGSELYTPVLSTIDVNDNDRVLVMIQNHTGTVTSNVSSPAVGSTNFNNFKTNTEGAIETLSGQYDYITANYASFDYLAANYATFGYLEAQYAKIETLESDYAKISTLESDYIKTTEIEAQYAKIATVDANYAHIDLANIEAGSIQTYMLGEGVVGTAQIADGSITDAKIVGLTANKITAGTLNAGVIDVVNLNADNITTGSINGNRIKDGAINYDKLAETVSNDISDAKDAASKAVISATDEYTLTDTTDSPTASNVWSTDTPTKAEGQYIWRRVVTRYGNGSITTGNPAMLTGNTGAVGEKGDQGAPGSDGVGIYSSKVSYRASSDGINVPDDDVWLDYIPELSEGEYLWTRTEIIYTDANKSVSYSVSRSGIDGVDGEDGKPGKDGLDISSVAKYYTLSSSMPTKPTTVPPESIWSENEPAYTSGSNSKLYSVELTVFSDNSFSYSTPCLSSSYEAAKDAYNKAQNAQTTANAKNAVIYQDYVPETTSDRKLYDVWFDTANGNLMYYWNGSAWTPRKFNTSALAEKCITADLVAANAITADNIVAGTITSAQLNTSEIFSNSAVITQIFAQNVTATGTITGGTFIGGSIKSSNYQAGTSPYSGAGMLVNLANGSIEAKKFGVTTSGVLYATEANISGVLTAGAGSKIGGWTLSAHDMSAKVSGNYIFFGDGSTSGSGNGNKHVMLVKTSNGAFPFFVRANGYLNAANANITGSIKASSISIENTITMYRNSYGTVDGTMEMFKYVNSTMTQSGIGGAYDLYVGNNTLTNLIFGKFTYGASATASTIAIGNKTNILGVKDLDCVNVNASGSIRINGTAISSLYAASSHTHNYLVGNGYRVRCGSGVQSGTYGFHPRTNSNDKPADNILHLGASAARWTQVWCAQGTLSTSDERDKDIVGSIDERYSELFMGLNIIKFKWKGDKDDITHIGIGAQSTERIAQNLGMTLNDVGFCHMISGTKTPRMEDMTDIA